MEKQRFNRQSGIGKVFQVEPSGYRQGQKDVHRHVTKVTLARLHCHSMREARGEMGTETGVIKGLACPVMNSDSWTRLWEQ